MKEERICLLSKPRSAGKPCGDALADGRAGHPIFIGDKTRYGIAVGWISAAWRNAGKLHLAARERSKILRTDHVHQLTLTQHGHAFTTHA